MIESSLSLRIAAIFEIALLSLLGIYVPFRIARTYPQANDDLKATPVFLLLRSLSAGVIAGVGFMHLLPDAEEEFSELSKSAIADYPLSYAVAFVGVMLCLLFEQVTMHSMDHSMQTARHTLTERGASLHALQEKLIDEDLLDTLEAEDRAMSLDPSPSARMSRASISRRAHSVSRRGMSRDVRYFSTAERLSVVEAHFVLSRDVKTLVKAYVLEVAVAVHSIIMGISLGILGQDSVGSIRVLMIAYGVHQFLEAIGLGCALSAAKLPSSRIIALVTFFALALPIGIVVGIGISSSYSDEGSDSQHAVEGAANALAAGILIYVSLVEMIAEDFSTPDLDENLSLKLWMIVGISVGAASMAVLAVWA